MKEEIANREAEEEKAILIVGGILVALGIFVGYLNCRGTPCTSPKWKRLAMHEDFNEMLIGGADPENPLDGCSDFHGATLETNL